MADMDQIAQQMNDMGFALLCGLVMFAVTGLVMALTSRKDHAMSQFRITDAVLFGNGSERSANVAYATLVNRTDGSRLIFQWRDGSAKLFGQYDGKVIAETQTANQHENMATVGAVIEDLLGQAGLLSAPTETAAA